MKHSEIKALRKFVGGYSSERRQCVRAVSEQISERRFEAR
jgi:hypothetical protein